MREALLNDDDPITPYESKDDYDIYDPDAVGWYKKRKGHTKMEFSIIAVDSHDVYSRHIATNNNYLYSSLPSWPPIASTMHNA